MDELILAIQDAVNMIASPNWVDISGAILSAVATAVTVFVAIIQFKILKKQTSILESQTTILEKQTFITYNQNRIALFEKRFEVYDILFSCKTSAEELKPTDRYEDILKQTVALLAKNQNLNQRFNRNEAELYIMSCSKKLNSASFFFSGEVSSYLLDASIALLNLITAGNVIDKFEEYSKKIQSYFDVINSLDNNDILIKIEKEMETI